MFVLGLAACDSSNGISGTQNEKGQVPVYQGMTISNKSQSHSLKAENVSFNLLTNGENLGKNSNYNGLIEGDYNGKDEDIDQENPFHHSDNTKSLEEEIKSTLDVIGAEKEIYYAGANEDIFITIHLNNPDNYEIVSFTLNGKKYSSYMFEEGSDMESLILEYNVGSNSGIQEYTIDAIKYIDGTDIKDVIMSGEKTVLAGIRVDNQVLTTVNNLEIQTNSVSFNVKIIDNDELISYSQGCLKAVLYDGDKIVAEKELAVGSNIVVFDDLATSTMYQYAIVGYYDDLSGKGFTLNVLYKQAFYTKAIVLFDNVIVSKESIQFDLVWDSNFKNKALTSLRLYKDGIATEIPTTATFVNNLLSNTSYSLVAEYVNGNKTEHICIEFKTESKTAPNIEIVNVTKTQTSIGFTINENDNDNVGAVTKIELLHSNGVIVADSINIREFTNLLSNNTYTIKVTYTYDLNDGAGAQTVNKTLDIKTEPKTAPYSEITNIEQLKDNIGGEFDVFDCDNTILRSNLSISNFNGEIDNLENAFDFDFDGLNCFQYEYVISLTLVYDLNDGKGEQEAKTSHTVATLVLYTLLDDDTYSVTGLANPRISEIELPETYCGKVISNIGRDAFCDSNISSASLPDTIKTIEDGAFKNCQNLDSVNMPTAIRHIGVDAFDGCDKIVNYIKDNVVSDTTYSDTAKWYMLKNDIQVKQGASLSISPNVILLGNGCNIDNYGTLNIVGEKSCGITLFNVNLVSKNAGNTINNFNLRYVSLHVGQFSPATGYSQHSNINIQNCKFYDSTRYTYIWYPKDCVIKNCYFENWDQISIGTNGRVSIMYNTFVNCGSTTGGVNSVIECWAAYGEPITVQYNNFINSNGYALSLKYDRGRMDARYNWFGTSDEDKIKDLIWDGNDDFSIPNTIDYSNYLTKKYQLE